MSTANGDQAARARGQAREQELGGTHDLQMLAGLWRFIRPYKRVFYASLALLPLTSFFLLAQPWIVKQCIDGYIAAGTIDGLGWWATAFGVAIVAEFFCLYWQHYFTMLAAQHALADLRVAVFDKVQSMQTAYFDRNPAGRLVTRMTTDIDVINEMFAAGALTIVMDFITLTGIIAIMLAMHLKLALVTLSVLPLMVLLVDFFRRKARRNYRRVRERIARLNTLLQESISGMAVVQLFARERAVAADFDADNALHRDANQRSNLYEASLFSIVEGVSSISIALLLWYGAHLVIGEPVAIGGDTAASSTVAGAIGFGTLVAFIEYINKFFVPVRDFSTKYAVMQSALTAAERVFGILELEASIKSPADAVVPEQTKGSIEFRNVRFGYHDGEPVLRGVSFKVAPGEHLAVVGATGSGKTTITKLLGRLYDVTEGEILIDGVDVRRWDLGALRRRIGSVHQDVFMFADTVGANIALWDEGISDRQARAAAGHVNADGFVQRLQRGYATAVRERGNNFSTGQRQLLAFARALAHEPEILVLDEATSSVDNETEGLIQDAVETLQKGRTSVVIAHRLSTIERADRILVLHHGEVREQGTHAELIGRDGLYAKLYNLQHDAEEERNGAEPPAFA